MRFRVLDKKGIRDIHDTALMLLGKIGMQVAGDQPRQALLAAGANERDGRIIIGEDLVEPDDIAECPNCKKLSLDLTEAREKIVGLKRSVASYAKAVAGARDSVPLQHLGTHEVDPTQ